MIDASLSGDLPLLSTMRSPALAREFVRGLETSWSADLLDAVLLAVSELVTNAVRYGQGRVEMHVETTDHTVRIEVRDANPEPPQRRPLLPADEFADHGLGLHLLDAITQAWGTQGRRDPPGKTVWAELHVAQD